MVKIVPHCSIQDLKYISIPVVYGNNFPPAQKNEITAIIEAMQSQMIINELYAEFNSKFEDLSELVSPYSNTPGSLINVKYLIDINFTEYIKNTNNINLSLKYFTVILIDCITDIENEKKIIHNYYSELVNKFPDLKVVFIILYKENNNRLVIHRYCIHLPAEPYYDEMSTHINSKKNSDGQKYESTHLSLESVLKFYLATLVEILLKISHSLNSEIANTDVKWNSLMVPQSKLIHGNIKKKIADILCLAGEVLAAIEIYEETLAIFKYENELLLYSICLEYQVTAIFYAYNFSHNNASYMGYLSSNLINNEASSLQMKSMKQSKHYLMDSITGLESQDYSNKDSMRKWSGLFLTGVSSIFYEGSTSNVNFMNTFADTLKIECKTNFIDDDNTFSVNMNMDHSEVNQSDNIVTELMINKMRKAINFYAKLIKHNPIFFFEAILRYARLLCYYRYTIRAFQVLSRVPLWQEQAKGYIDVNPFIVGVASIYLSLKASRHFSFTLYQLSCNSGDYNNFFNSLYILFIISPYYKLPELTKVKMFDDSCKDVYPFLNSCHNYLTSMDMLNADSFLIYHRLKLYYTTNQLSKVCYQKYCYWPKLQIHFIFHFCNILLKIHRYTGVSKLLYFMLNEFHPFLSEMEQNKLINSFDNFSRLITENAKTVPQKTSNSPFISIFFKYRSFKPNSYKNYFKMHKSRKRTIPLIVSFGGKPSLSMILPFVYSVYASVQRHRVPHIHNSSQFNILFPCDDTDQLTLSLTEPCLNEFMVSLGYSPINNPNTRDTNFHYWVVNEVQKINLNIWNPLKIPLVISNVRIIAIGFRLYTFPCKFSIQPSNSTKDHSTIQIEVIPKEKGILYIVGVSFNINHLNFIQLILELTNVFNSELFQSKFYEIILDGKLNIFHFLEKYKNVLCESPMLKCIVVDPIPLLIGDITRKVSCYHSNQIFDHFTNNSDCHTTTNPDCAYIENDSFYFLSFNLNDTQIRKEYSHLSLYLSLHNTSDFEGRGDIDIKVLPSVPLISSEEFIMDIMMKHNFNTLFENNFETVNLGGVEYKTSLCVSLEPCLYYPAIVSQEPSECLYLYYLNETDPQCLGSKLFTDTFSSKSTSLHPNKCIQSVTYTNVRIRPDSRFHVPIHVLIESQITDTIICIRQRMIPYTISDTNNNSSNSKHTFARYTFIRVKLPSIPTSKISLIPNSFSIEPHIPLPTRTIMELAIRDKLYSMKLTKIFSKIKRNNYHDMDSDSNHFILCFDTVNTHNDSVRLFHKESVISPPNIYMDNKHNRWNVLVSRIENQLPCTHHNEYLKDILMNTFSNIYLYENEIPVKIPMNMKRNLKFNLNHPKLLLLETLIKSNMLSLESLLTNPFFYYPILRFSYFIDSKSIDTSSSIQVKLNTQFVLNIQIQLNPNFLIQPNNKNHFGIIFVFPLQLMSMCTSIDKIHLIQKRTMNFQSLIPHLPYTPSLENHFYFDSSEYNFNITFFPILTSTQYTFAVGCYINKLNKLVWSNKTINIMTYKTSKY